MGGLGAPGPGGRAAGTAAQRLCRESLHERGHWRVHTCRHRLKEIIGARARVCTPPTRGLDETTVLNSGFSPDKLGAFVEVTWPLCASGSSAVQEGSTRTCFLTGLQRIKEKAPTPLAWGPPGTGSATSYEFVVGAFWNFSQACRSQ